MFLNRCFRILKNFWYLRRKNGIREPLEFLDIPEDEHPIWWGPLPVPNEQSRYVKVGHTVLCIDHHNQEWHLACRSEDTQVQRYTRTLHGHIQDNAILLQPLLPNRALVSPLTHRLLIPPKDALMLYVSAPIWIGIGINTPSQMLDEIPTQTLAETWYGTDTQEGELCYAGAHASPQLDELSHGEACVITPISVVNYSQNCLLLTEVRIPFPFLSMYSDSRNRLWTDQLDLFFENHSTIETVIADELPRELGKMKLVSKPRQSIQSRLKNLLTHWRQANP